jgi:cytochrome c oxidase assembly protein subunit 15
MLKDQIGIFHACLAQAFFGILVVIAVATTTRWQLLPAVSRLSTEPKRVTRLAVFTALAIYVQLGLGATMRHQHRDLSILDFPTAYGQWIPDTSPAAIARINSWRDTQALSDVNAFQIWLQMIHRFGAVMVALGAAMLWAEVWRMNPRPAVLPMISNLLVALVLCQIGLGAWTIWSNKAADIATAHVALGATIFALTIAFCAIGFRLSHGRRLRAGAESPVVASLSTTR